MRNQYFTFLYNECKRLSHADVDINEIKQFMDSDEGQKGYQSFCAIHGHSKEKQNPIKHISAALTGFSHER